MGAFVYLRDADFNRLIDLPELEHITQGDGALLAEVEAMAREEVALYLGQRYDMGLEFRAFKWFALNASFAIGDRVLLCAPEIGGAGSFSAGMVVAFNGAVYEALGDTTLLPVVNGVVGVDWMKRGLVGDILVAKSVVGAGLGWSWELPDFWSVGDDRCQTVVRFCVDVLLYHLFAKVNPRAISELRVKRYDDALRQMKMVSAGTLEIPILRVKGEELGRARAIKVRSALKRQNFYF